MYPLVQSQAKPLASDKVALLGDLVLRHVQSAKNYNKLTPKQEGPYRVRQVARPGAARLKTEEGLPVSNSWGHRASSQVSPIRRGCRDPLRQPPVCAGLADVACNPSYKARRSPWPKMKQRRRSRF